MSTPPSVALGPQLLLLSLPPPAIGISRPTDQLPKLVPSRSEEEGEDEDSDEEWDGDEGASLYSSDPDPYYDDDYDSDNPGYDFPFF